MVDRNGRDLRGGEIMGSTHRGEARIIPVSIPVVIGADRDPRALAEKLLRGAHLLVFGPLGCGKSLLLNAVCAELRAAGTETLSIRATTASHDIAFGSLTNGSNLALGLAFSGSTPVTAAGLLAYAQRSTRSSVPLLSVDDAHLLDARSLDCLYRLAEGGAITLLMASAVVSTLPGDDVDPLTVRLLDELWITATAERLDLAPASAEESRALVREFEPTATFDRVTLALLHSRSGGSRVLLRELTSETLRRSLSLRDGQPVVEHAPSARILDLLAHHLHGLTDTQLATLIVIDDVDGTGPTRAVDICGAVQLGDLIRRGFLSQAAGPNGQLETRAMLADAARVLCDPAVVHRHTTTMIGILLADQERGFALTPAECAAVADSFTASGALLPGVLDTWGADLVARVLLSGARRSRSVGLTERALVYSRLTMRLRPQLAATIEYSRALAGAGRHVAALAVLTPAEDCIDTSRDAVTLLRWRMSLSKFSPMTADDAAQLSERAATWVPGDETVAGAVAFIALTQSMQQMHWTEVSTDGEQLARTEVYDTVSRVRAACLSSVGHAHDGRTLRALQMLDLAGVINEQNLQERDEDVYSRDGLALEIYYCSVAVRCMSGQSVHVVTAQLDDWIDHSMRSRDLGNLGLLAFVAAELSHFRGDVVGTDADMRVAAAHYTRSDTHDWHPWIQCLHASSLARMGIMQAARNTRHAGEPGESDTLLQFESGRFDLEYLLHSGSTDRARRLATQLHDTAKATSPLMRAWLLDILVQLGEPAVNVLEILDRTAASSDAPLVHLIAQRTRAVAEEDAPGLDRVAELFAELGAFGSAMTASDDAAELHEQHGESIAAASSRRSTDRYLHASGARGDGGAPGAPAAPTVPGLHLLTDREREITELATEGLSNRAIAERLFLSVRTVESHLYQARTKTGQNARNAE